MKSKYRKVWSGLLVLMTALTIFAAQPQEHKKTKAAVPKAAWEDYQVIMTRNMFLRNREAAAAEPNAAAETILGGRQVLTGILIEGAESRAFFENSETGARAVLMLGETLGGGKIAAIEWNQVLLERDGRRTAIPIGADPAGNLLDPNDLRMMPTVTLTLDPNQPENQEATSVEERMRQRRLREIKE